MTSSSQYRGEIPPHLLAALGFVSCIIILIFDLKSCVFLLKSSEILKGCSKARPFECFMTDFTDILPSAGKTKQSFGSLTPE